MPRSTTPAFCLTIRQLRCTSAETHIRRGFQPRKIVPGTAFELSRLASKQQASEGKFARAKILIAPVTVLVFVLGTMASGIYSATSRAFNPIDEKLNSPAETAKSTARITRSDPQSARLSSFGGSAGGGAAIGAVAGGGKGRRYWSGFRRNCRPDLRPCDAEQIISTRFRACGLRVGSNELPWSDPQFAARNTQNIR